jgi:hypothetical protein
MITYPRTCDLNHGKCVSYNMYTDSIQVSLRCMT